MKLIYKYKSGAPVERVLSNGGLILKPYVLSSSASSSSLSSGLSPAAVLQKAHYYFIILHVAGSIDQ